MIGLTALGTTLIASSAFAVEMSVSGGASLTLNSTNSGKATAGNGWTMGDSLNFTGSGEMDNGWTVTTKMEIDAGAEDDHSFALGMGDSGTLTFHGHGGSSALGAVDDVTPNAYEESWDVVTGGDAAVINGAGQDNMFVYQSPSLSGATITIAYVNAGTSGNASTGATAVSYSDVAFAFSPEMAEGLTVGFATGDTEEVVGTKNKESTMYAKYAYGPVTVGYQVSENDLTAASSDVEMTSMGVSYAITDNFSVAYNQSTFDKDGSTSDIEASGISWSYTMGSMTFAGAMNEVENIGYSTAASADREGYEMGLSFAF